MSGIVGVLMPVGVMTACVLLVYHQRYGWKAVAAAYALYVLGLGLGIGWMWSR